MNDRWWNPALRSMPVPKGISREERAAILDQAAVATRVHQRVVIAAMAIFMAALAAYIYFEFHQSGWTSPMLAPFAVFFVVAVRVWKDRAAARSVREQLRRKKNEAIESIIASQ